MVIDFHYHALLWKKCPFYMDFFMKTISSVKKQKIDAIAITDHYNAKHFEDIYRVLDEGYPYNGEYYLVNGIKVFPGVELSIQEHGHIIAIGRKDDVLEMRSALYNPGPIKKKPSLMKVTDEIEKRGMLGIWAHPIRRNNPPGRIDLNTARRLRFMDFNGKDLKKAAEMRSFEKETGLIAVSGSDTHHPFQAGVVKTILYDDCNTLEEVVDCIGSRRFEIKIHPFGRIKCEIARRLKRIWKRKLSKRMKKEEMENK